MADGLKERIGASVRAARKSAGMTQEDLAAQIDRHVDSVSLIERGRTMPTVEMLVALATALNLSISELVPSGPLKKSKSTKRLRLEVEISQLLEAVPDKRLEVVRDQVRMIANLD